MSHEARPSETTGHTELRAPLTGHAKDPEARVTGAFHTPLPRSVSVVVTTFRRPHLLADVVRPHLTDQAVTEVIIVDDGSGDETETVCAELASRNSKVKVVCQSNAGEAASRARGAAAATGDLLLFLDDDVVTADGVASRHLAIHMGASVPLALLGYMPPRLSSPRHAGQFPVHLYRRSYERRCRRYELDPSSVLLNLWGGHFSVRRETFFSALGLKAKLPYHEDRLLGWSLRRVGCVGAFERNLVSEHRYSRSPEQFFADCRRSGRAQSMLASLAPREARVGVDTDLGPLGRAALRMLASRPYVITGILDRGILIAGWARWWGLETVLARVLATLEGQVAFRSSELATRASELT
jgi:GT2 family glycosyltransferase